MFVNNCLVMKLRSSVFVAKMKYMPSRTKTVGVTVEVWKELLQDMMLIVHDALADNPSPRIVPCLFVLYWYQKNFDTQNNRISTLSDST